MVQISAEIWYQLGHIKLVQIVKDCDTNKII